MSLYFHSDPICQPLVSIQEMRNTLVNLTIETIEHGIPSTFADPRVVNFDKYGKFEQFQDTFIKHCQVGRIRELVMDFMILR